MASGIVEHAAEALSKSFWFKCRRGNCLRKQSFEKDSLTLQRLLNWVSEVHDIPREELFLEFRASDLTDTWIPLDSEQALEAAIAPVLHSDGNQSVFARATSVDQEAEASYRQSGSPPTQPAQAGSPGAVLESVVMVSTTAPLTEFQNADDCQECGASFGYIFGRRHHCRVCNRSFCHDCADGFFPLCGNPTPVRHCSSCATVPREQQQAAEARSAELANLEVEIQTAAEAENFEEAAKLKARKDVLLAEEAAANHA